MPSTSFNLRPRDDEGFPDLYSRVGLRLPVQHRPPLSESFGGGTDSPPRFQLLRFRDGAGCRDAHIRVKQASFIFRTNDASPGHIVHLGALHRRAHLDYGVYDVLRDVEGAAKPALQLEKHGVWLLGLLVQLSRDDIRSLVRIAPEVLDRIETTLRRMGLGFNTRIPWWVREYAAFRAGH